MTVAFVDVVSEQVPATDTTIYTAGATISSAQIVFGACNATTSDSLTVNIVQSGGAVAATNAYITAKTITSGTVDPLTEIVGAVLHAGDFISVDAATASRLNLKLTIKEIS